MIMRIEKINFVLIGLLLLTANNINSNPAYAEERECSDGPKKGYWFYCKEPVEETDEEKIVRKELPNPPPHEEMMKMHPDDLKVLQEEYLKEAVWKSEPEKVLNYYMVHDVIRRKSLAFTAVSQVVMLQNPDLNVWGQYSKTNPGVSEAKRVRQETTTVGLSKYRQNYALLVFTKPTCGYCSIQKSILAHFSERHGWHVKEIDITRNTQAATRFNINYTPVTIVIERNSDNWMPVAVGEEPLPSIEENTYRAIRLLRGDTSPTQFFNMDFEDGGVYDPSSNITKSTHRAWK